MIDTRYLIDPSGIVPEWIADNRDLCDPREEDEHNDGSYDSYFGCPSLSRDREDRKEKPDTSGVVVDHPATDDHNCIGIRHRDGVRTWPLVD